MNEPSSTPGAAGQAPLAPLARLALVLAVLALVATVVIGFYMARPWSGQPPYDGPWGLLGLAAMLAWACGPHAAIAFFALRRAAPAVLVVFRAAVAVLVCGGGTWAVVDAAFIHVDPQSALVLVFFPVYQWLLIGLGEAVGRWLARRGG